MLIVDARLDIKERFKRDFSMEETGSIIGVEVTHDFRVSRCSGCPANFSMQRDSHTYSPFFFVCVTPTNRQCFSGMVSQSMLPCSFC